MSDRFEQLLKTLNQSELEMTSYELADLCWLLLHSAQIVESPQNEKQQSTNDSDHVEIIEEVEIVSSNGDHSSESEPPGQKKEKKKDPVGELSPRQESKDLSVGGGSSLTFPVDNPSDLGSSLSLARALKPLLRRIPTEDRREILDEVKTVESFAATDQTILVPVFKPALEPWLELALVVDRSSSMDIWHQTLADLKTVLQHYGIFHDVQVWQLALNESSLVLYKGLNKTNSRISHPKELLNPNGRSLILVVSDCVASYWQDGKMFKLLEEWSKSSPLAILQMLPEWLWLKTGLGLGAKVTMVSDEPGLINSRLKIKDVLLWENVFHHKNRLQIPVFTLEAVSVERWSGVVVGRSNTKVAGFVLTPDAKEELDTKAELNLSPEEIVRRFRNNASTLAQELAELLAAAPTIFLPVVRLIRKELLPEAGQVQIAEVFLGGILRLWSSEVKENDPDLVLYDFIDPQVRKILQRSSTRSTTVDVFDRVSKYIAKQLNLTLRDFLAELKKPPAEVTEEIQGIIRPFAQVSVQILETLGGEYARFAREELSDYQTPKIVLPQGIKLQPTPPFDVAQIVFEAEEEWQPFEFITAKLELRQQQGWLQRLNPFRRERDRWVITRITKQGEQFTESLGNEVQLEIVAIPGGTFIMGTEDKEIQRLTDKFGDYFKYESPQREVTIQPFSMSKYPITQRQWKAIAERTDLKVNENLQASPSYYKDDPKSFSFPSTRGNLDLPSYGDNPSYLDRPVEKVNWYQAKEFCDRLSTLTGKEYRLPTEAEWEYACRAVIPPLSKELTVEEWNQKYHQPFYFGETITSDLANYQAKDEEIRGTLYKGTYADEPEGVYRRETTPVGMFPPNAFGLYDMHGNVWEWCEDDWHDNYNNAPKDGSAWLSSESLTKLIRGGSFVFNPRYCRSAYRNNDFARDSIYRNYGFRVVCVLPRTY